MYPELFHIGPVTIYSYGFMIMIGAITGYVYMSNTAKRELGIIEDKIQTLAILVIVAAVVGGKFFFYLEKPSEYFSSFDRMISGFKQGFVFYGSLLFALPLAIWYFRKQKWPLWPMLDILAITATLIHGFGRLGCFLAGCCYGVPTDLPWGVSFTHPLTQAEPTHTNLHPTQLYESSFIFILCLFLIQVKRHRKFEGQVILLYIAIYALGRMVIETLRGDLRRGFIFEGFLSHSQFISILLLLAVGAVYYLLRKKQTKKTTSSVQVKSKRT